MKFSRMECKFNVKSSSHLRFMMIAAFFAGAQPKLMSISCNEDGNVQDWSDIAVLLPGRTNKNCRKRWSKIQVDIRKGTWTRDEDERLQQAVQQIGAKLVAPQFHADGCTA